MNKLLLFLNDYAILFFLVLIIAFTLTYRKYKKSLRENKEALFSLEKELSNRKRILAISVLWIISLLFVSELLVLFFIIPSLSTVDKNSTQTSEVVLLPASTIPPDILSTLIARTPDQTSTIITSSCIPGLIMISNPKPGESIRGIISLYGTANIPNFGFYKYEYTLSGEENWVTIQAGREMVTEGKLGDWNTSEITPGDYLLRLVVLDNLGRVYPECEIPIRIMQP